MVLKAMRSIVRRRAAFIGSAARHADRVVIDVRQVL
jgi:hypothetical protein